MDAKVLQDLKMYLGERKGCIYLDEDIEQFVRRVLVPLREWLYKDTTNLFNVDDHIPEDFKSTFICAQASVAFRVVQDKLDELYGEETPSGAASKETVLALINEASKANEEVIAELMAGLRRPYPSRPNAHMAHMDECIGRREALRELREQVEALQ